MEIKLERSFLATLRKGSTIPASVIGKASGLRPGSEEYRLAQLLVGQAIRKHFKAEGVVVVTRCRRNEVVILTDAEASVCCGDRGRHALRKMGRAKSGLEGVDCSKLSDAEIAEHNHRVQKTTFMYTAARRASRKASMLDDLARG